MPPITAIPTRFAFCLYVAGDAPNSADALANLNRLCAAHLDGRHDIEIVDVFADPERALADGIFLTPCLMKVLPLPRRSIVGTLSDTVPVLQALGLASRDRPTP